MAENVDAVIVETFPEDRSIIVVDMPEVAVRAITRVIGKHNDEFDEALAPFGLSHRDMLQPAWMRPLRKSDVLTFTAES